MCKKSIVFGLGLLLNWGLVSSTEASVTPVLKQADAYRLQGAAAKVETEVTVYRNEQVDKERRYTVYLKPGRRSLVLMKSPSEIGQKVLMLADQFWLLMPDSQRPLRITPSQKLLGEASTGDIASMTWSEDYNGELVAEEPCPTLGSAVSQNLPDWHDLPRSRTCLHLDLSAVQNGVTYSRIELYVEKGNKLPVKADLYVGSGKRAKEAWYGAGHQDGQLRITSMLLLDDIQVNRRTLIRYRNQTPKEAPDEFYNPAALVRNSLSGW